MIFLLAPRLEAAPQRIHARLIDNLAQASVVMPNFNKAFRRFRAYGRSHTNPYSKLSHHLKQLVQRVAFHISRKKRQYDSREAIYAPAPSVFSFSLTLPRAARLVFSMGALRSLSGRRLPQVRFLVEIQDGNEINRLFTGIGRPGRWTPVEVNLSSYAGRTVTLKLITEKISRLKKKSAPFAHGLWGTPVLFGAGALGRPNVLLIVVDSLSRDAVGHLGNLNPLTPRIDALARQGAAFTQAFVNGTWTRASTLAFLGSDYSTAMGINVHNWWLNRTKRRALYRRFEGFLPNLLRQAGYMTAAVVNNLFILGYHSAGVDTGFEWILDHRTEVRDTYDITDEAKRFLRVQRERPFFLLVNYNAPHDPYRPPKTYLKRVVRMAPVRRHPKVRKFLAEVAFADDYIGRLLDEVKRLGLMKNTMIIITADHGEGLRSDIAYLNPRIPRFSRFTHSINPYSEVNSVPLVFHLPGKIPSGTRIKNRVRLLDLAPTVLDIVGLPKHPQHRGVSLKPLLYGQPTKLGDLPVVTEGKRMEVLRLEKFSYVRRHPGWTIIARVREHWKRRNIPEELYDLQQDPREIEDLAPKRLPVLVRMRRWMKAWRNRVKAGVAPLGTWLPASSKAIGPGAAVFGSNNYKKNLGGNSPLPRSKAARYILRGNGDGRPHVIRGTITTSGRFVKYRLGRSEDQDSLWLESKDRLVFTMVLNRDDDELDFMVAPPDASVKLKLTLDGAPFPTRKLYVGPYGLNLLKNPFSIDSRDRKFLYSKGAPHYRRGAELGIFLWRAGESSKFADDAQASDDKADGPRGKADSEIESVLKEWGYIQKSSKKGAGKKTRRIKKR